ncbi:MAG: hypothetical protein K0U41_09035, partial [Gammaproteobacteria bacterium]|nr:hypothetical protein [Gammaproteobacteria bacterium]
MSNNVRRLLYKIAPFQQGNKVVNAVDTEVNSDGLLNALNGSADVQEALARLDATGLGSVPKTFTGNFTSSYGTNGNQGTWYGFRQSNMVIGERGQSNGNYRFELPDISELNAMFDDLASKGLGEVFTLTIGHLGGSTSSIARNSLTITPPSISALFDRNEIPTTIGQGASATFRIERVGGVLSSWERLGVQQSTDPVATFGEVVIQTTSWNNADNSFLPGSGSVLKGYAFPVSGSNPNDGTLRQGLLDAGVSDRIIYDGDYVVWTADAFTSWSDGDNWFVINRDSLQRMSREQSNFLSQVIEIDNRVDISMVNMLGSEGVVWLSENPLVLPPFITPSTDPNNPRSGDDYTYVGGRENRDQFQRFQLSHNLFNSYLTVGISPNFILGHELSDIFIYIRGTDGNIIETLNLADDFVNRDDENWSNSTYTHYVRNTSVNYPFLATIEVWLTQVQRHFRLNSDSVDITANIADNGISESKLDEGVRQKLNAEIPSSPDLSGIEARLCPYKTLTKNSPAHDALFLDNDGTTTFPTGVSDFNAVSASNPRFTGGSTGLFVAVPEPGNFALRNITTSDIVALDQSEASVNVIESFTENSVTYFVYTVSSLTSGHVYEVERVTIEQVLAWPDDIDNLEDDVKRIDAKLEHAALNLPDAVVQVLDNNVSVSEEDNSNVIATDYNKGLGDTNAQTVFYEDTPNTPSGGALNSRPINLNTGDRARRKLVYFPQGQSYFNQAYLTAFDGTTSRDLITYLNGRFFAKVFVPAIPAGTSISTIYPAPPNKVSGEGIWINIPALTFQNGVPVPLADETFFTRNIPSVATTLTIQYRGHANGNIFGAGSITLVGVGGSSDVFT